ncbi:MAG TPA: c-type cytochrome biogenesis protein CcsB [Aeromicrobium sp.]|nr:c-type cytochrome biogenesis protein CcsB [Aeromicrobium sp.]HKY56839.1 c-type cytochrome biogenesis protein CcsB [Aeromicrobium sp.]
MTSEAYAQASTYLIAAATVVLAIAFVAHVAEWALARGADEEPTSASVAAGIGRSVTVLALLILLAGVVTRGLAAGRVPWGNMYEFGCAAVVLMLVAYLVLMRRWGRAIDWTGAAVTGIGTVVLGASMLVYVPAGPLVPALHSYWLVIHVFAAMLAGAAFVIGAIASAAYLLKSRNPAGFSRLPSATRLDEIAFKVNAFAFPIWTFAALISGPIWAQYAWGRYWGWDPKEVWAFITWVVYAGYLHARATAGWKGRAAAILCLVGFATFVFNFIGVNLFVGGLHSYAK